MQQIKSKRKKYDLATYAKLTSELTQVIKQVPHLAPDRQEWDIDGNWSVTGAMHFVDSDYMPMFQAYADFDCRTIKLVNFGRPAIRMTFFKKHSYWLIKDASLSIDDKKGRISDHINMLYVKADILDSKSQKFTGAQRTKAKSDISAMYAEANTWKEIMQDVDQYEIAVSNYKRDHYYTYINYKFRVDESQMGNENVHLLNPQRNRTGAISQQRHNVVFVHPVDILREHPYQNKEIDGFLNSFPLQTELGKNQIYARIKPDLGSVEAFEKKMTLDPITIPNAPQIEGKRSIKKRTLSPLPLFDGFTNNQENN